MEISDRDVDAMARADNRMGEFASWDDQGLASILSDFSLDLEMADTVEGLRET